MSSSTTGGGRGTNQYQVKGRSVSNARSQVAANVENDVARAANSAAMDQNVINEYERIRAVSTSLFGADPSAPPIYEVRDGELTADVTDTNAESFRFEAWEWLNSQDDETLDELCDHVGASHWKTLDRPSKMAILNPTVPSEDRAELDQQASS